MFDRANGRVVQSLWDFFQAREWRRARELIHDGFVAYWPHTGERICGGDDYIAINENYPGDWRIRVLSILGDGSRVVSEVVVELDGVSSFAASFFDLKDGKLLRLQEYWVDERNEKPPAWREKWVEQT